MNTEALESFLDNKCFIFHSPCGKKGVELNTAQRLRNRITDVNQLKDFQNYNLFTGYSNVADIDLDCPEVLELADYFLIPAGIEFGRESTPRSHRLYKILDMDKKKHTRSSLTFRDSDKDNTLIELRAHNHYTMCGGLYDNKEKVVYNKLGKLTELNYDQLHKNYAMLALAAIILRKVRLPIIKHHNEFYKEIAGALCHHKVTREDAERIFDAVITKANCSNCIKDSKTRLAQRRGVYKRDKGEKTVGLPTIIKKYKWSDIELEDIKKALYSITGRSTLPSYTHEFVTRIAYMMKQKKYYDLEDKESYDAEAIDVKYSKNFDGRYTPLKYWKQHPDSKVCVDFTYKPATKSRFVTVDKKLMINIYEPHDLKPDPSVDTDLWDALVEHVIPHVEYRNHFLDWIAYIVQNPGKKIRHGIIMQSDEFQLGKGSLYDVVRDILGRTNAKKIELDQALDKGKGYLINSIMVLIDEAKSSGKWEEKQLLLNTMKTIITEGSVGIRQLYKEYTEQDTCTNYWVNTNHKDAFALPPNEVRYWVYFSEAKRNEKLLVDYHDARYNYNLAGGVYAKLLNRNVSKFKPLGVAPHTPYRDMMTKLADKPVNDYIRDNFEQGVFPLDRDLVTTVELLDWLKKVPRVRVSRENDVANALKLVGGVRKRGCLIKDVGNNVNVWIIRDHDKYENMTANEIGKLYVGFWTGE